MIKLDRHKLLWILMIILLGLLLVSLLIYFEYSKRKDSYDIEVLKSHEENVNGTNDPDGLNKVDDRDVPAQLPVNLEKGVTVGKPCSEALVDEEARNVLIIGEDKKSKLYDTVGVVSIDSKKKTVTFIMFPRDTYIEYSQNIMETISTADKLNVPGFFKLNNAHYIGALTGYKGKFTTSSISFLAEVIGEKFGIDVDDFIKVNTEGLVEAVDLFEGIDINVPYDMNYDDLAQDLHIHLSKGQQHMDGRQAEGFVRFRQGYREDGTLFDVDRKKNQITFLKEFVRQHGTISNIDKIPHLLDTLSKNVKHSIGFGDMLLNYTGIAKDIINEKYSIESININGEEKRINGSSYIIVD